MKKLGQDDLSFGQCHVDYIHRRFYVRSV